MARAVARSGRRVDPSPEGKLVEAVDIVALPVIEDRDPAPDLLNWFHFTSLPYTIRREVLLRAGDRYDAALAAETARNLRALPQLSVVLTAALEGDDARHVRLLVITKDIWSIRLNSDFEFAGGKLQYLVLQPSEHNLFGTHHAASALFSLDPGRYSLGAAYEIPRLAGSHIDFAVQANVLLNRASGALEGSYGSFSYGQPLTSTRTEWAWGGGISWRNEITRRFVGGELGTFDQGVDHIPYEYKTDQQAGSFTVTRSVGREVKHDFSLAMSAQRELHRAFDLSAFTPASADAFRADLPVSDTRIGPSFGYHTYGTSFLGALDLEMVGLQEDYRLGHDVYLSLTPITRALRSSRDFLGVEAGFQFTDALGDGLLRFYSVPRLELAKDVPDSSLEAGLRFVSPTLGFARLIFDGFLLYRFTDYLNARTTLGGDGRLRGYPTRAFVGKNAVATNVEVRTRAVEVLSVALAGVLFYDAGDAFDLPERMNIKHSVGFGARLGFPQVERIVTRIDWGFPLDKKYAPGNFPGDIILTFGQAFDMPAVR